MENTKFFILVFFVAIFIFIWWLPQQFTQQMRKYNLDTNYLQSGLNYRTLPTGLENSEVVGDTGAAESSETHCAGGLFLDIHDLGTYDCQSACSSTAYEFKYIDPSVGLVLGNRNFAGSYCMPKESTKCNLSTGRLVNFGSGFSCISKYPTLFGGPGVTQIVGCNGLLTDKKTGIKYVNEIAPDTVINPQEKIMPGNTYRYECTEQKDERGNALIPLPPYLGDRFVLVPNLCLELIPLGHPDFKPNFKEGTCNCTTSDGLTMSHYQNSAENPCSNCIAGFGNCQGCARRKNNKDFETECKVRFALRAYNVYDAEKHATYEDCYIDANFFNTTDVPCVRSIIERSVNPLPPEK